MNGCFAATVLLLAACAAAQSPRVQALVPAGGSRGSDVAIVLRGERLAAPLGLLLAGPGIEVLGTDAGDAGRCTARLRLAADCPPGPHALRLRTASGLSNLVQFHVGALPCVAEARQGDAPQTIALDCTVDGELRDGEVDRYRVEVPDGERVHVACEAMRLGLVALDTRLTVSGPDGRELARADDSPLGLRDPSLSFALVGGGTVQIELRPAQPGDGRGGAYRLHVGLFHAPFGTLPCGGQPGEQIETALLTDGEPMSTRVSLPADGREVVPWHPVLADGRPSPAPIWLRVGGPPNRDRVQDPQGRWWLDLPGAVHGVVTGQARPAVFQVRCKRAEEVEFRVIARTLRSALDATLTIKALDGRVLAANDDQNGIDSSLRFTPPNDGDYVVEVGDLLRTGSPQHFFRLEGGPRERPRRLALQVGRNVDPIVTLPQGGSAAIVLQLTGIGDQETLGVADLPAGVSCTLGPRLPGSPQVVALFSAAVDAPLAASQVRVGIAGEQGLDCRAFRHALPLLTGRNDAPLLVTATRTVPLVVTTPAPFTVTVQAPVVPLIRGAALTVPLQLARAEGFDGRVRLRSPWAPPGVTVGQANLERGVTAGALPIEAGPQAPLGEFPCVLVAGTRLGNLPLEQALPFVRVRIEEPWANVATGKVRLAQGQQCTLVLAVTDVRPRQGPAKATLLGLPRGVTAAEVTLPMDSKDLRFLLAAAADAAIGRHADLRVELRLPDAEGRPVLHRFPAGELRVTPAAATPANATIGAAR